MRISKHKFFFILIWLFPVLLSVKTIFTDSYPLSFDASRDLLLAWDNLTKPTLIGPPTGIPGIFYGPYWIWLLSFGMLFSKDPSIILFTTNAIPYLIIMPLLLLKFSKVIGKAAAILIWFLFTISYQSFITSFWNPHLAPLLFLILCYFITQLDSIEFKKQYPLFMGITTGLILNIHFSFGLAVAAATFLYLFIWEIRTKRFPKTTLLYILSFFFVLVPFFAFEMRHGFNQTKALIQTVSQSVWYNSSVVGHTGLHKIHIINRFFRVIPSETVHIPRSIWDILVVITLIMSFGLAIRKKLTFEKNQVRLLSFLCLTGTIILGLFLSSKNPVWEYHFIGIEIGFLLLLGVCIKKLKPLRYILVVWVTSLLVSTSISFVTSFAKNPLSLSSLASKKYIVSQIVDDANGEPFSFFAYSPSIYTYDYDYLFKWLGNVSKNAAVVYIIIPPTTDAIKDDFIHYKTPDREFETVKQWTAPDGTLIIVRKRLL